MNGTRLTLPDRLRPRWRQLPTLAALAQRRLGPRALHRCTRPAACWLWLTALAALHAAGRVLAHGSATVSVTGPRMTWPRRAAYGTVLLLGATVSGLWLWLPLHAATHATAAGVPPPLAYGPALAVTFSLLWETASMLARTRATASPVTTVRHLRSQGGTWWEAGTLVAHEEDPLSAGRLVRAALALADHHHAGLVVVPNSPAMHRAYTRLGFSPGPLHPDVLIRHPHAPA